MNGRTVFCCCCFYENEIGKEGRCLILIVEIFKLSCGKYGLRGSCLILIVEIFKLSCGTHGLRPSSTDQREVRGELKVHVNTELSDRCSH